MKNGSWKFLLKGSLLCSCSTHEMNCHWDILSRMLLPQDSLQLYVKPEEDVPCGNPPSQVHFLSGCAWVRDSLKMDFLWSGIIRPTSVVPEPFPMFQWKGRWLIGRPPNFLLVVETVRWLKGNTQKGLEYNLGLFQAKACCQISNVHDARGRYTEKANTRNLQKRRPKNRRCWISNRPGFLRLRK